jgi:hypothetical protein
MCRCIYSIFYFVCLITVVCVFPQVVLVFSSSATCVLYFGFYRCDWTMQIQMNETEEVAAANACSYFLTELAITP